MKRWLGHPLFMYAGLSTFFRTFDRKQPHFQVTGESSSYPGSFTVVLNASPYTYLGNRPLQLAPSASLNSALTTVTFPTMPLVPVLRALTGAIVGTGVGGKFVVTEPNRTEFTIESDVPFPYQLDGDYLGEANSLRFRWEPHVIRVVLPS
jgi:diacylglycerol kinase family enzyme